MEFHVLVINPGSTSTKIAVFRGKESLFETTLRHSAEEIAQFPDIPSQKDFRKQTILDALKEHNFTVEQLDAVVGRGGLMKPLKGGTYRVSPDMLEHLMGCTFGAHASNLGAVIANEIATPLNIPAFIVDPVSVDEVEDVMRITGLPEMENYSRWHALNLRAIARRAAGDLGGNFKDFNFVMVHLGGGITVAALKKGQAIAVNNALDGGGPMSPERAGSLPTGQIIRDCFSGKYTQADMLKRLAGKGGLVAHIGTNDTREVTRRIREGDKKAEFMLRAMAYQIATEIGAKAVTLHGDVRAIVLTGGIAHQTMLVDLVEEYVSWIAPVMVYPGEDELQALAEGGLRVLNKEELPLDYATREPIKA